jgi:REP element-mobilizing transposase RayT
LLDRSAVVQNFLVNTTQFFCHFHNIAQIYTAMVHEKQGELLLHRGTHGGWRPGAGRKPGPNPRVRHRPRSDFAARFPCHVTLKVAPGLPSLRNVAVVRAVTETFRAGAERGSFRLLEWSIQDDHLHAIVEAKGAAALGRGMKSLAARFAKAVNRGLGRRGPVLRDRYHVHVLRTVREVRNALAYALNNARRHLVKLGRALPRVARIDPASSGAWFQGWRPGVALPEAIDPPPVARATTWLASVGWRKLGLLDPAEV